MKKILKILWAVLNVLAVVTGVLSAVYFWKLDQKLLDWAYDQVNRIFERKKQDGNF